MNKLSFFGVGPRIGIIAMPWLVAAIILTVAKREVFSITRGNGRGILIAGAALMLLAVAFYANTVRSLLKGLRETRLITTGSYRLCRNPLYASFILLFVPALALLLNSWLVLTTSVIGYILFRIFIAKEDEELQRFFGEEYLKYKRDTPSIFPFPLKKLKGDSSN